MRWNMLNAYNANGRQVVARDVTKADGPFHCTECGGKVAVKKGVIKVHHFAHVPPFKCTSGVGESEEHRAAKQKIYDALLSAPEVSRLMIERLIKQSKNKVRLDVSCCVRNRHLLTIELQYSAEPPREIARRTSLYTVRKIHVLWLLPYPEDLLEWEKYRTTLMERYMHMLYFGTVYYWRGDDIVMPVHFHKYSSGSVYREWYDEDEKQWYAGRIEQIPKFSRL